MCDAAYEVNHELLNDFFGLYKELWGDKRNNIDFKYNPTNLYIHLYEYSKFKNIRNQLVYYPCDH